jgi:hypothetical protein
MYQVALNKLFVLKMKIQFFTTFTQKDMAKLYLDYLYHNHQPISEYVKVFDENNQFISIKENNV